MIDINSKNLLLRKFKKKDIDKEYLNWFKNNKNFIYSRHKDKYYDFKDLIQYFNIQNSNKDSIFLICIDKITNKKVGTVTIYLDKQINVADVGILIVNDDFKNKGFSKIILKYLFHYLFLKFDLQKISMGTHFKNIPMIKSCLKIGMKQKKIKLKKNIIYFEKYKKKISFIGIICKDLGSAVQIYHYIKNKKNIIFLLYLEGPAKIFFKRNKISNFIFLDNISKLILYSDYVISGTGTSTFEKNNMLKVLKNGINLKAVIDHITNLKERFLYNKKKILPSEILVFDMTVYEYIKNMKFLSKKKMNILKLPNYFFDTLKKKFSNLKKKQNYYLFIGEPFRGKKNNLSIDQAGLKNLSINLNRINKKDIKLIIRLHPKQTIKDFKKYKLIATRYCKNLKIYLDKNNELYKSIKMASYVIGLTSYALLASVSLKCKTFHCLNASSKIKPLPDKKIRNIGYLN